MPISNEAPFWIASLTLATTVFLYILSEIAKIQSLIDELIMFYGDTVQETRQMFFNSWEKYQQNQPLLPLENEIVQVILAHPEYHQVLESRHYQQQSYFPELGETNPFLHMGLHLAIREQVNTNRPVGINALYKKLVEKYTDPLAVEHLMMDQLAECLWLSQKNNLPPDETIYLNALAQL